MNPIPKTPPKRATVRKTSDRVSRIAAQLLNICESGNVTAVSLLVDPDAGEFGAFRVVQHDITSLVESCAASCLAQDEVRGTRSPKKRKAKGKR